MRRATSSFALVVFALVLFSAASAQQASVTTVPNLIRYGGALRDAQGAPFSSSAVGVTFAIYNQQDGGAPVWMETQTVTLDAGGNYGVLLGSTTAAGLPADLFSQQEQRWLGVQVQGQSEEPRVLLVSVPYAFKAHEAETLGGKSVSDFVLASGASSSPNGTTSNQASSSPAKNPSTVTTTGIRKGDTSDGPTTFSGSTTDQIVGVTQSGTGAGINASAPNNAVVGNATASYGYALYGIASGVGGIAVKGASTNISGTGVRGIATATTGATTGISSYVASPNGIAAVFNNAAGGKILSGQNDGVEAFAVDGSGNVNSTSGTYRIGGNTVLSIGSPTDDNLFLGAGTGTNNVPGSGERNTFSGFQAGYGNTSGVFNTFSGSRAGYSNTTGGRNTFSGASAGFSNTTASYNSFSGFEAGFSNTTANDNTFSGADAGYNNTTGNGNSFSGESSGYNNTTGASNTFSGENAGFSNTTGYFNTFSGENAGFSNTTANDNTFSGADAGYNNTTGGGNTFYGNRAGYNNTTGDNNVYISNEGTGSESSTIRIGGNTGDGPQTAAYIAGIYGSSVDGNGIPVYVDNNGQLGTVVSSRRFKEQIADMGDSTDALMELRPVTFLYKPEYSNGDRTLQYGLIAEEVAQVYPELVAYDNDGQPYTVRYQYLTPMLLNEVQKQYRRAEAQADVIKTQEQKIDSQQNQIEEMQQRLSRLEALVGTRTSTAQLDPERRASAGETQ